MRFHYYKGTSGRHSQLWVLSDEKDGSVSPVPLFFEINLILRLKMAS